MGLLDKLKNKITGGIASGVGNAVRNTAERKTQEAVQGQVDKVADKIIKTGADASEASSEAGGLAGLAGIMSGYAASAVNEAAKNLKICPKCEEPASADKKFCPSCGAALPEQTVAEGAVCKSCGKQNTVGEKFCSDCGAKLPFAEAEEQAAKLRDDAVMERWEQVLPQFPKWSCGGREFSLEECGLDENDRPYYYFTAHGVNASNLADYRTKLKQAGFRPAGEYPSEDMLYKRIDGVVFCFSSEEAFMSDPGYMSVLFSTGEPRGGFDYVKPETKEKKKGFFGLFK